MLAHAHLIPASRSGIPPDRRITLDARAISSRIVRVRVLWIDYVTKLNRAIVRTIESELSGSLNPAAPAEILRTGGNPTNGTCVMASQG